MRVRRDERGFTMAWVAIAGAFISLVGLTAVTAVRGDLHLTRHDLDQKQAYEAAKAGLADYQFHLNKDSAYWTLCDSVPAPSAVNQEGSTANRRSVPGTSGATYAIELLPATGYSSCDTNDPAASMIEATGPGAGMFRIRATGYSQNAKQSIVASFRQASFLDYLYFTQLETSDPVTYDDPATITGAYEQCTLTEVQGRYDDPIPGSGGRYCDRIYFIDGEWIRGPLHTNDSLNICGQPTFGRTSADNIEVSAPPQGYTQACGANPPNFVGTYITNAPILTPPPSNGQLATIADPAYRFTGQTRVVLNGSTITITDANGTVTTTGFPPKGVIYVSNGSCSSSYSPFTATYPATSGCGDVYVSGDYDGRLTIAAENDIIVEGHLIRNGNGMLGLIANNFIRVYHGFPAQTGRRSCNGGGNDPKSIQDLRIDAAMLAIQHSFIVDHYDCGGALGTLTVNGAISQRFRGPVGTFGGTDTGYRKNYNYDDRLRYVSPPHFLDPVQSAWHIQRETLDFP